MELSQEATELPTLPQLRSSLPVSRAPGEVPDCRMYPGLTTPWQVGTEQMSAFFMLDRWLWENILTYYDNGKQDEKSGSSWPSLASLGSSGFPRWSFERRSSYWQTHPTLGEKNMEKTCNLRAFQLTHVDTDRNRWSHIVVFLRPWQQPSGCPKLEFQSRHVTAQEGWSPHFFKLTEILWDLAHFKIENYEESPLKADPAPVSSAASGILEAGSPSN